ncbi:MAG: hypothetical protein IJ158_00835 [Treponema sp.]|nr:hypothetical protein [Treponema sp.]
MNNEICEKMMENFLSLDKNERIPLKVTLHLLACKKCRSEVHALTLAEKYAAEPLRAKSFRETLENMSVKPVSMTKWIIWGVVMIFLMVTFGLILNRLDRASFAIIFNVIFGVLITVYCALFVATNMDFFVKKIDKMQLV